jgi:hypothetical protein
VSLLRYISFAVDAGTTVGAKVMWDVLGRKAVFLHTSSVNCLQYLYICETDLDCILGVVESDIGCFGINHQVAVDVAD